MTTHLPADLEESIKIRIDSGHYLDDVDVIRAALNALDEREHRVRLISLLDEGKEGDSIPFTSATMGEILREAEEVDRRGLPINPDVCP